MIAIMINYELSAKWIRENSDLVKKAYNIAVARHYDINSAEDALELLKEVDPVNATVENAKIFSGVLQIFGQQVVEKLSSRQNRRKVIN